MKKLILFVFFILNQLFAWATHIKAGDILITKDSTDPLAYYVTLNIYYDYNKVLEFPEGIKDVVDYVEILYGDNTPTTKWDTYKSTNFGNNVLLITYYFKAHYYPSPGTYTVSYQELNRIKGILNMDNSVNTQLYLESQVKISPFLLQDELPMLLNPPLDVALVGRVYKTTPGAYDRDGDSLAFQLIPPKKAYQTDVDGYVSAADPKFGGKSISGGTSTITIDPFTGIVTWDTPGTKGLYNIAILITEYRNGTPLGYVVRDMQIYVDDDKNRPPVLEIDPQECIIAGSVLKANIRATDPDNDKVAISLVGDAQLSNVSLSPTNPQTLPALSVLTFNSTCDDIRDKTFDFQVKATDDPIYYIPQSDYKTLNVKVFGPSPENLKGKFQNNAILLSWKKYTETCSFKKLSETAGIYIYRNSCDTIVPNSCTNSKPAEFIAKVLPSDTSYLDTKIKHSQKYFYTIRYETGYPQYGVSNVSNVVSVLTPDDIATLSGLLQNGERQIIKFDGPKTPISGWVKTVLYISTDSTNNQMVKYDSLYTFGSVDSSFTVIGNSFKKTFRFKISIIDSKGNQNDSEIYSSLGLNAKVKSNTITLEWKQPESLKISKYIVLNGDSKAVLKTIGNPTDSIYHFEIEGLENCSTYCYFVEAIVSVCPATGSKPFTITSNMLCEMPRKGSTPAVSLSINPSLCDNYSCKTPFPNPPYVNTIHWKVPPIIGCDNPTGYNIYYQESDVDTLMMIGSTTDTFFIHNNLETFAGCYLVKTVSSLGEEGGVSNTVCQDLCPCFDLPNIVTPNEDALNDLFIPLPIPRFIETVHFKVYNRWGGLVYDGGVSNDINIHWNPKNLSEGIYYYQADVVYMKRAKDTDRKKTFKGWVQVAK